MSTTSRLLGFSAAVMFLGLATQPAPAGLVKLEPPKVAPSDAQSIERVVGSDSALPVVQVRARGGGGGGFARAGSIGGGARLASVGRSGARFASRTFASPSFARSASIRRHHGRRFAGPIIVGSALAYDYAYDDCGTVRVKERTCWRDEDGDRECGTRWVLRNACD